jgi:hypothetical protein
MEKIGDTAIVQFGDNQISGALLCKYGAISVNILNYHTHKMVYIIFRTGYYPTTDKLLSIDLN